MIRPPAVAGRFYPSDPEKLTQQIEQFVSVKGSGEKVRALGCMVPHAGYMYSGQVAGAVYASIEIPRKCILLGPRHFPRGEPMAILTEGSFLTPLGEAKIDPELAAALAHECTRLREDAVAHEREHSLEVQIPFLQFLEKDFRFVPVVLATDRYGAIEELGRAVAKVIAAAGERVLVVASTDMNHYENDEVTRAKDGRAIERILALDPRGLYDTVRSEGITMCGYAATTAMLVAMREVGATEARLVRYATSGDVSGDREQVVGYAGVVIR
ncbi:MAG TPA: AmmeMemoRadiSam system protein B [Candidatus Dormibacteraeota bacterium]|nr:AmmeMemoRadiSam system protein B [Candidatus Dormibacteraeota bacterium]